MSVNKIGALVPVVPAKGSDEMCFCDTANGMAENALPDPAKQHGDNPMNSSRPKMDNDDRLINGPFGGHNPQ